MSVPMFTTKAQIMEWLGQFVSTGASVTTLLVAKTPHGIDTAELDFAMVIHDLTAGYALLPDRDALAKWMRDRNSGPHKFEHVWDKADALLAFLKGENSTASQKGSGDE